MSCTVLQNVARIGTLAGDHYTQVKEDVRVPVWCSHTYTSRGMFLQSNLCRLQRCVLHMCYTFNDCVLSADDLLCEMLAGHKFLNETLLSLLRLETLVLGRINKR